MIFWIIGGFIVLCLIVWAIENVQRDFDNWK